MDRDDPVLIKSVSWSNTTSTKVIEEGKVRFVTKELACRKQVPLKLGWALSIHRSQSMSIDKLAIDFTGVFESSQVYVALSRARSLQGLQVVNFCSSVLKPDPVCVEFNNRLLALQEDVCFNGMFQHSGIWASADVMKFLEFTVDEDNESDDECCSDVEEEIVIESSFSAKRLKTAHQ